MKDKFRAIGFEPTGLGVKAFSEHHAAELVPPSRRLRGRDAGTGLTCLSKRVPIWECDR